MFLEGEGRRWHCGVCHRMNDLSSSLVAAARDGLERGINPYLENDLAEAVQCQHCSSAYWHCNLCGEAVVRNKASKRNLNRHYERVHPRSVEVRITENTEGEGTETVRTDTVFNPTGDDAFFNPDDGTEEEGHVNRTTFVQVGQDGRSIEAISKDKYQTPTSCLTSINGLMFPNFRNEVSDAYFGQEYAVHATLGE